MTKGRLRVNLQILQRLGADWQQHVHAIQFPGGRTAINVSQLWGIAEINQRILQPQAIIGSGTRSLVF